ncbi:fimbria/pilus periplasmic chaperone [Morganella morganii]|uniref:fimbria/pilus periplasmic chaperone n=1 Tax=Morganella morganii TaxID=582 RepID=UPI0021D3C8E7|nr:fimbria/pilus periplasmic chaperone [Morganella morganii]MCU6274025.1 fimbria/pilus periplasmic chaperone [Morganella morganii]
MQIKFFSKLILLIIISLISISKSHSAISLDRTRVIFNESDKSVLVHISNDNKQLPYLAQAWLENDKMQKITKGPIVLTPPLQRVEPDEKSLITLSGTPDLHKLPQDRESVFYFILREIPPKSIKENTLQIALQTKIKLFYRPKKIEVYSEKEWQNEITLASENDGYRVINSTPFYLTIVGFAGSESEVKTKKIESMMIPPKSSQLFRSSKYATPYLSYINDYGGRSIIQFSCNSGSCVTVKK